MSTLFWLCVSFFILAFADYKVITRGRWYVEKPIRIPNFWWGHSTIGIICVLTANYIFLWRSPDYNFTPYNVYFHSAIVFLSALPGIYLASVEDWKRYNDIVRKIAKELGELKKFAIERAVN